MATSGRVNKAAVSCAVVAFTGMGAVHTFPENDSAKLPDSTTLPGSCATEMLIAAVGWATARLTLRMERVGYGRLEGQ